MLWGCFLSAEIGRLIRAEERTAAATEKFSDWDGSSPTSRTIILTTQLKQLKNK